jgi:hypothetical protein
MKLILIEIHIFTIQRMLRVYLKLLNKIKNNIEKLIPAKIKFKTSMQYKITQMF